MDNNSKSKPFYKKWWFWAAAGVFCLGGIFTAIDSSNKLPETASNTLWLQEVVSEPLSSDTSKTVVSEIESGKIYTVDEFCSFFENDDDFAHDHADMIFTVNGTVANMPYYSVEFKSGFESKRWKNDYKISCNFDDKEAIKNIKEGAAATISGSLFSLATSGIVLEDCTLISFENPVESISETETSLKNEDIWETEEVMETSTVTEETTKQATEQAVEMSTAIGVVSEAEPPSTWETVGNKKAEKTYILNTGTKKIHKPNCSSVKDIKPENYAETDDYDAAISQGYEPCKRCHPYG